MKKIGFLAIAAIAAMSFTSCGSGSVSAEFNDEVDSIAYDLGVGQAEGLKQYMTMQLGVDSAYIDEFIKGVKEGNVWTRVLDSTRDLGEIEARVKEGVLRIEKSDDAPAAYLMVFRR